VDRFTVWKYPHITSLFFSVALAISGEVVVRRSTGGRPRCGMPLLTGMRRGELLGLRWQDVDLAAGGAHVQQTAQRISGRDWVFRFAPSGRCASRGDFVLKTLVGGEGFEPPTSSV